MRGLAYYAVWKGLGLHEEGKVEWSVEEQNNVLGRFRGFFTPVGFALLDMAVIEFTKMFDEDSRTASLTNLLRAARKESNIVPHVSAGDLRETARQIKQSQTVLTTLKRMRDQRLVHVDADPTPVDPLLTKDFDALTESVKSAFNTLSVGHDGNVWGWDYPLKTSEQHTDEARRAETTLGRPLNIENLRPIIKSLGLTEEQMQRVEKEYSSGASGSVLS